MKFFKSTIIFATLFMLLTTTAFAANPWLGKMRSDVVKEFGEPANITTLGHNCDIYFYEYPEGGVVEVKYFKFCTDECVSAGTSEVLGTDIQEAYKPYINFPAFLKPIKPKQ